MNRTERVIYYLKKYYLLSVSIFLFVVFGSFLEMFNIGLLFPILQGVIGSNSIFSGIPLLSGLDSIFKGWARTDILSLLLLVYIISFGAKHVAFYFGNVAISKQRFLITRDLQLDLFDKLMRSGMKFYDSTKTGYIVNSLYNETTRIGNFINCALRIFAMAARLIVNVMILFFISWQWTVAALLVFAVVRIPLGMTVKSIRALGASVNRAIADFNFTVLEIINGIRVIRIFSDGDRERRRFKEIADKCYEYNYSILKKSELLLPITQVAFLGVFLTLFLLFIRVARLDLVKVIPYLVAYLYVSKNVLTDLGSFQDRRAEAAGYLGSFDSYENFNKAMEVTFERPGMQRFEALKEGIRFNNVRFGYSDEKDILKGISLVIPKGKMTAIVGSSGIGKTTMINLVLGFYEITEGRIEVDGSDLRDIDLYSWRTRIGLVSQDVFIFNASARENIAFGRRDASDEEVRKAARIAEIDRYLESLPEGYDTILGERGVKLSGGQRQRISIARAIMQNPEILIFDEATSHLDSETERQIQNAIDKLAKNRTVILIAHRFSTIQGSDNIVVLDNGNVVEGGSHAELMSKNGVYRRLYETQFNASK
ncbi:MAG: ABC transporter ATP-binding protein [Candidatus Omnitrophica bacterium]|nr:ABC transporter ATP-binding protein [Candidatus Omnitrophota bacterium]